MYLQSNHVFLSQFWTAVCSNTIFPSHSLEWSFPINILLRNTTAPTLHVYMGITGKNMEDERYKIKRSTQTENETNKQKT